MKITRLSLDNVRAFEEAEFTFNPGFNLIIGINGAGKSTALDTIRFCGSHLLPALRKMPFKPFGFSIDDIHDRAPFAEAALHINFGDEEDTFIRLREWREPVAAEDVVNVERLRREILESSRPRERLRNQLRELQETVSPAQSVFYYPSQGDLKARAKREKCAPLMVHYSTARSYYRDRKERTSASDADQAAYYEALASSTLNLRLVAEWLRAQHALANERPESAGLVASIEAAINTFLPGYSNLRTAEGESSAVLIDHDGLSLNVLQLSDGERSLLALVLDLAKRLAQANNTQQHPLIDCGAIVLIDEIDLHLHPQWQRKVVANLERTFPNCQFIATTHSPQIISETQPERITLLKAEDGRIVPKRCGQAYGLDTNYILEHLMGTPSRPEPTQKMITAVEAALDGGDLDQARAQLAELRTLIHGDDPTIAGLEATINNLEALGDAADH